MIEEGTLGREFYVIAGGSAVVKRRGRKITTLGTGDHFGELALLDRRPRNATVVSDSEISIYVLSQSNFKTLLEQVPSITFKLMAAMAGRLREKDEQGIQ